MAALTDPVPLSRTLSRPADSGLRELEGAFLYMEPPMSLALSRRVVRLSIAVFSPIPTVVDTGIRKDYF